MNKNARIIVIVAIVAIALVGLALAFRPHTSNSIATKTLKIEPTTFVVKLPENGTVMHPHMETIPALVSGNLASIYAKAGSRVSAGELLATIENPSLDASASGALADYQSAVANVSTAAIQERNARVQYQAGVDTAKSSLDEARRVLTADETLYADKAIPRSQLDADRAKEEQAKVAYDQSVEQLKLGAVTGYGTSSVQAAKAQALKSKILNDQAQQQLSFERIVAPFSGIIQSVAPRPTDANRTILPGDAVSAGQAMFTIAEGSNYVVQAQVDEQDVHAIALGMPVNVTSEDFPKITLHGHVARISPIATRSTDAGSTAREVLTTIALDDTNPVLRDGMTANVDILTTSIPHALVVPTAAIVHVKKATKLWLVRDGKAHEVAIVLGKSNDLQSVVRSGLSAGDTIVASAVPALHEGMRILPIPQSSPSGTP
ncbi:MAG: efflux RND transporter periplasmic adaptor subunit [Candidatus Eremiobacteraeota bacterium]|uniref:Uncharacterized protein n=1 Tax=mine drainage metagenome TaxID=410659 RepID=E6PFQ2_9ZZZZ|nr:efflux RND transporter periplasmic adaptor subunit [Candidatus Eremiobacteraeota bacterium]